MFSVSTSRRPARTARIHLEMNTVPHRRLVQFVESAIAQVDCGTIFTHHPGDLPNDHRHASIACQAAARLYHRRRGIRELPALYSMETFSSTDCSFPGGGEAFLEDTFFNSLIDRKIEA
jgi:hypothetical protein